MTDESTERAQRWAEYMRDNEPPEVPQRTPMSQEAQEAMLRQLLEIAAEEPDPALVAAWDQTIKGAKAWADKHRKEKP